MSFRPIALTLRDGTPEQQTLAAIELCRASVDPMKRQQLLAAGVLPAPRH